MCAYMYFVELAIAELKDFKNIELVKKYIRATVCDMQIDVTRLYLLCIRAI